ncbi:MAG: roadblock/LC7 domain-containing protein [Longimicrobiales bacterium]|nr:roadblock/LC7 domain-containing protein [Longimicrobiales bacterium]
MKRDDLYAVAEAIKGPMKDFVRESRVRTALLVNHSGQVLAQRGFSRGFDVGDVATLAAAAHSSAHALAKLTDSDRWTHLHHAGREKQIFLAPFRVGDEELILIAIFDDDSTLGLVQLFFDRLVEAIREIPQLQNRLPKGDAEGFERDLEAGVERLLSEPEDD